MRLEPLLSQGVPQSLGESLLLPTPHLDGIPDGAAVYFVHSYYPVPDDAEVIATTTDYGGTEFVSSIWWRNIFATQFHPEKSQAIGLRILANFGRLVMENPSGLQTLDPRL